jgi:adenosylmethionine-8-amino-7-oxononanoate aminotransferase
MTNTPEQLSDWDLHHHWHAFTQMAEYRPLVIERAEGCWLVDHEGKRYLDGVSSMWCNLFGHRHPRIDAAIKEQLDRVAHNTSLGMGNATTARLAKRLADLAPGDLEHVFFASDGSSAVESALKMAFQYWRQVPEPRPEKTKFLALGEAYHGDTLGSASVGGIDRFNLMFAPLFFDVFRVPSPDRRHDARFHLDHLEQVLAEHHGEIAAMVVEPLVQGAAGIVLHPPGYLAGVRELTRKYDVLLIADEIVTGFGRTGRMFACEQEGVVPDFLCLGKGITGGYLPLSATITRPEIYQAFLGPATSVRTFMHGHTYGGNPLAAAAALATLDILQKERVLETLPAKFELLADLLTRVAEHPRVAETRQLGLIAAVELTPSSDRTERYPTEVRIAHRVCSETLKRGVWLRPLGDVLVIMPPLSIGAEELGLLGDVLAASIDAATSAVGNSSLVGRA